MDVLLVVMRLGESTESAYIIFLRGASGSFRAPYNRDESLFAVSSHSTYKTPPAILEEH